MHARNTVIVDGYNVVHRIPALADRLRVSLESARCALLAFCAEWLSTRKDTGDFRVVFDGESQAARPGLQTVRGIRVVFTKTGESADDRIAALVKDRRGAGRCTVVSDDNEVRRSARAAGATAMSASSFWGTLRSRRGTETGSRPEGPKSSMSPAEERSITESLRKAWCPDA